MWYTWFLTKRKINPNEIGVRGTTDSTLMLPGIKFTYIWKGHGA
jgi:hypothetical protein